MSFILAIVVSAREYVFDRLVQTYTGQAADETHKISHNRNAFFRRYLHEKLISFRVQKRRSNPASDNF